MYLVDYKIVYSNKLGNVLILKNTKTESELRYRVVIRIDESFRNITQSRTAYATDEGAEYVARAISKTDAIRQAIEDDLGMGGMLDLFKSAPSLDEVSYGERINTFKSAGLWFDIE